MIYFRHTYYLRKHSMSGSKLVNNKSEGVWSQQLGPTGRNIAAFTWRDWEKNMKISSQDIWLHGRISTWLNPEDLAYFSLFRTRKCLPSSNPPRSLFCIVPGYRVNVCDTEVLFPATARISLSLFLLSALSRQIPGPTQPFTRRVMKRLPSGQSGRT